MQNRRDFLGSVIGILATSGLPFKAIEAKPYLPAKNPLNEFERILEVLKAPRYRQESCRLILRLAGDILIAGPKMSRIEQPCSTEFKFFAEDFEVTRSITICGFQLVNWRNEFVNERKFERGSQTLLGAEEHRKSWQANPNNVGKTPPAKWQGDVLKASYHINIHLGLS